MNQCAFAKTEMVAVFRNPRRLLCVVDAKGDSSEFITLQHSNVSLVQE